MRKVVGLVVGDVIVCVFMYAVVCSLIIYSMVFLRFLCFPYG